MNRKDTIFLIITISTASLYTTEKGPISELISRLSPEALIANPFNDVYAPMVQAMQANSETQSPQATTQSPSFKEQLVNAAALAAVGALANYGVKRILDWYYAAPDDQKVINIQRQTYELERIRNNDLLLQKFRELQGDYLICKRKKGDCDQLEEEFIRVGGQLAADIINKNP